MMKFRPLMQYLNGPMLALVCMACYPAHSVLAEEIRAAVASNFRNTARVLAQQFNDQSDDTLVLVFGSSGKHFAQINKGAPFDLMLSADSERPEKLETSGHAIAGSRLTYALGKISLWSSKTDFVDSNGEVLRSGNFSRLAMANPRHAPYGIAAQEVLKNLNLQDVLADRIVLGSNVDQAFQYVTSGNAELGIVARSQLAQSIWGKQGSRWDIPDNLYLPIEQQAILITEKPGARKFLEFLTSQSARQLIAEHGYGLP